jgi:Fe-S-cluster containining protein
VDALETELQRARELEIATLADAILSIGFECTRCGACCTGHGTDEHTATVFPDEIRRLRAATDEEWRDVARPMPYGLTGGEDGPEGETFEWALQTTGCGDCRFYEEADDGTGACSVHPDRPLVCRTYPFSVALGGTAQPMGDVVDQVGPVQAHQCEGLGRDITTEEARDLAGALKERAVRELEEAIAVGDAYEPTDKQGVVVFDSEGPKRADGSTIED